MSKVKHPKSRAERLRIKAKKEKSPQTKLERLDAINKRYQFEALEQKEALDELRKQVLQTEEEERALR